MPDLRHDRRCPICHGHGDYLDEVDPDQGPIYEPCPIAEQQWVERENARLAAEGKQLRVMPL